MKQGHPGRLTLPKSVRARGVDHSNRATGAGRLALARRSVAALGTRPALFCKTAGLALAGTLAVLAGCSQVDTDRLFTNPATLTQASQFVSIPLDQMWIREPDAVLAMMRSIPGSLQQRIGLENKTAVPGDNYMLLDARAVPAAMAGRFNFDEFTRRIGGLPAPFSKTDSGQLLTGEDALGPYFWVENRNGADTVCVLGLRRLTQGVRQMPANTNVIDVMLRNCVNGATPLALRPLSADNLSGFSSGPGGNNGGIGRMLSPLAGPTPQ